MEDIKCKFCKSIRLRKEGFSHKRRKYYCNDCKRYFVLNPKNEHEHHSWTKNELYDLYYNQGLTIPEIGRIYNASKRVTYNVFKSMGIKLKRVVHPWTKEILFQLYWRENLSTVQIASKYETTPATIQSAMKRFNIPRKSISEAQMGRHIDKKSMELAPKWKGGRRERNGYISIKLRRDSFFYSMTDTGGYVAEHRLVVATSLGRNLHSWEIVHHLNHNRSDNRIENLQLVTEDRHSQITILECKIKRLQETITKLKSENQLLKEQQVMGLVRESLKEGYKID